MSYTNSSLISYTVKSPNHSGTRTHSIDRITPHCVVGQLTAQAVGNCFTGTRKASCNYGIGTDGKIVLCVDEKNRSWCSSNASNDQRSITIECASDKIAPYAMNDSVYNSLINLCTDICQRNGKTKLLWFTDKSKTLNYTPQSDEMIITVHRWFANKSCPGDWLYNRLGEVAETVTKKLSGTTITVQEVDYSTPSDWAKQAWEQAISEGITDGTNPKKDITREQALTIIYRKVFNQKSATIEQAWQASKDKDYTDGSNPKGNATRKEVVTFIYRISQNKPTATMEESWTWAKSKGVTDGSNENGNCTREQLIVMLGRL